MKKPISLDDVEFAMMEALAKRTRQKPDQYLKSLIRKEYDQLK